MADDPDAVAAEIHLRRTASARETARRAGVLESLRNSQRNLSHQVRVWFFFVVAWL